MPFESQWARIPLGVRWGVSLLIAAGLVVLLVRFVDTHNGNGEVPVSAKNLRTEDHQASIVIGEDQAPVAVHVAAGRSPQQALVAGVRRDMDHRISTATIPGPLTRVGCARQSRRGARVAYHCVAIADHVGYPFYAVATPTAHRAVFCKKDFPPNPSQNIPVSRRCLLPK